MMLAKQQLEHWHARLVKAARSGVAMGGDAGAELWSELTHLNDETPYIGTELIAESFKGNSREDLESLGGLV
jgi:hypothetical protein